MTASRDPIPDRDYTHPHRPMLELSTLLVISISMVLFILAVFVVLFGLDEWIPAIRMSLLVFALAALVWLLVTLWAAEFRHRRESK